ncbi:MAG TPA: helix-turn-helix domain-containing protein [Solirubrobacteraceae bacterium]|jgi:DNA-binding HxlR family transcriptional regulator|nr:helix-turn-helix domain-containing protein [Solirubrobacteraceae bacterium]
MTTTIQMTGVLDPRDDWTADHCPMAEALDVVRTRSAFLILREAFYGATRFEEFAERTELSEPVTAARLQELTAEGILEREPYREPGQRTRQAYRLTDKGSELLPVLVALMQWGDRWQQDSGARVELRHRGCGAAVTAQLRCADDHPVPADELELAARSRRRRSARS